MRYILNNDGYIFHVSFGAEISCSLGNCTEYTGEIPTGYSSLEEWHDVEIDRLNAWKVVDGNLIYDANKYEEIQAKCEQENNDNAHVTRKELEEKLKNASLTEEQISFILSNAEEVAKILPICTKTGKIILIDNASENLVQGIEVTTENTLTGIIKLILNGKNILKNTAISTESAGISYKVNADRTIIINGTINGNSELVIAGTGTSTVPIFVLKKDTDYYLEALPEGVELRLYANDGTDLTLLYNGFGGEILRVDNDEIITYATINITSNVLLTEQSEEILTENQENIITENSSNSKFENTILKLMLSVGSSKTEYEKYKEQTILISLDSTFFESTDKITIDENGNVNLIKPTSKIQLESVTMPNTYSGFNTIYAVKDANLKVDYKKSGFDYLTSNGNGTLVLSNTADGYGSIRKLTIENLDGEDTYSLISSNGEEDEEIYTIDLTKYTGPVKVVIEEGKTQVYQNDSLLGTLDDIYIKTYSPTTYIEVESVTCNFTCEYMVENEFSIYCTRVEKNASIKAVEDMIKLEVSRAVEAEGKLQSSITVEADKITQIVESVGNSSGNVTPASIIQAINKDGSSIQISADKVDIEGVTFPSIENSSGTSSITALSGSNGIEYESSHHLFNGNTIFNIDDESTQFTVQYTGGSSTRNLISADHDSISIGRQNQTTVTINGTIYINGVKFDGVARFG